MPGRELALIFPYLLHVGRALSYIVMSGSEMEKNVQNILVEGQSFEKALRDSFVDVYTQYTYQDIFDRNPECATCGHRYKCLSCRANVLADGKPLF